MNKIILIGRLANNPEIRYTPSDGKVVTRFTIAVNGYRDNDADFIRVVTWNRLAEVCAEYLVKGKQVAIEGQLKIRSYTDQNGVRRISPEVVASKVEFLGSSGNNNSDNNKNDDLSYGGFADEDAPF
jgi:single-strand DNA-binding protein